MTSSSRIRAFIQEVFMRLIRFLGVLFFAVISLNGCAYVAGWKDSVEQDKISAKEAKTNNIKMPAADIKKPIPDTAPLPKQNTNVTPDIILPFAH